MRNKTEWKLVTKAGIISAKCRFRRKQEIGWATLQRPLTYVFVLRHECSL